MTFQLDGEPLNTEYDEHEGHLVRLDPKTHEFVGVTILDFKVRWAGVGNIRLQVPTVQERVLQPA